ncbi:MAG: hypothetical protein K6F30_03495 [Lachnospiraceae bacterium]|nr:hypothetical protein [Lachnospiraceae bacterium]
MSTQEDLNNYIKLLDAKDRLLIEKENQIAARDELIRYYENLLCIRIRRKLVKLFRRASQKSAEE